MPLTADQILSVFPHPTLTPIVGEPTLVSITLQQNKHNGNLASITSNLGDRSTGLLVISMKPSTFQTIHPGAFVKPTNPGAASDPVDITAANSTTKIVDIYRAHKLEADVYSKFVEAERISVKLALDSTNEICYKALKHKHMGYARVSLRNLLDHLVTTYAAIDQFDLEANQAKMTERYNPASPIETLFDQISNRVAFIELGDRAFTPEQIADTALLCVAKTGVFQDDIKNWNPKAADDKAWKAFKMFFAKAHQDWKANLCLTSGKHFPRANAVDASSSMAAHNHETVEALANLATTTAADRATVATLIDIISQLSSKLASAQVKLIPFFLDNKKLLNRLSERGRTLSGGGADKKTSGGGASNDPWSGPQIHYCYSHSDKCPHPSFKCPDPVPGHIKNSTKKDIHGGLDKDYKPKNE